MKLKMIMIKNKEVMSAIKRKEKAMMIMTMLTRLSNAVKCYNVTFVV